MSDWKRVVAAIWMVLAVGILAGPAWAQDGRGAPAGGASDPVSAEISVEDLALWVKPLTVAQLEETTSAWRQELAVKVRQIGQNQVAARALGGEAKVAANAELNALREQRTAIVDRMNVVMTEWWKKGADEAKYKEYEKYIASVSGIAADLDVTDASGLWASVQGWFTSPEGGQRWGLNLMKFFITLIVTWIVARLIAGMLARVLSHSSMQFNEMLEDFFVNTTRNVLWLIGFIVALSMLEVEIGPFLAAMGVVGFVIGFALQETLGNFAAGIMILVYRPYDLGNFVTAGGVTGSVASMNLVSTTLTTPDNQTIIVPNGKIWGGTITNVTGNATRRVDMTFGIAYSDDVDRARALLEEIVAAHELTLKEPEAVVRLHELADSSVNFIVRTWANTSDYWNVYWDVTTAVKKRFDAEGISIPFPQRDLHVYQESGPAAETATPPAAD